MLKIYPDTASVLQRVATPISTSDLETPHFTKLLEDMYTCMKDNDGIGLAAPQVGYSIRLFVMELDGTRYTCINPEITSGIDASESIVEKEGCLSFPGLRLNIKRPDKITVKYLDESGTMIYDSLSGINARCFQHELDHLNGVVFTDKVSKTSLSIAKKNISKNLKKKERRKEGK